MSVCTYSWWQTNSSYCRMFLYILYRALCVTFIKSCNCFFWLLVYLFLLKVEVCMSQTCSCTKDIFGKKNLVVWKEPDRCKQPRRTCFGVFLQSDLIYFDIPQRKKLILWSDEGNDCDHSWCGVFVRASARSCVSERICDVFLIKIVLYTRMHRVSRWLFLTHNANGLKCCCNGLILSSHVQDRPFGQYCCTVSTMFSSVRKCASYSCLLFLFLKSDEIRSVGFCC